MKDIIDTIKGSKRLLFLMLFSVIVIFCAILNYTFSAFTLNNNASAAYLKIKELTYDTEINGVATRIMQASSQSITKNNIYLTSTNDINTNYELTYEVCSDSACNNILTTKPSGITVEYSSKTTDAVSGVINSAATKTIRIVVTNDTDTTYYIKVGVNAGYAHNVLSKKNLITTEFEEADLFVKTYVLGNLSNTFPNTNNYDTSVTCNNGATGTVTWDSTNTRYVFAVSSLTESMTVCKVEFNEIPPAYFGWGTESSTLAGADTIGYGVTLKKTGSTLFTSYNPSLTFWSSQGWNSSSSEEEIPYICANFNGTEVCINYKTTNLEEQCANVSGTYSKNNKMGYLTCENDSISCNVFPRSGRAECTDGVYMASSGNYNCSVNESGEAGCSLYSN